MSENHKHHTEVLKTRGRVEGWIIKIKSYLIQIFLFIKGYSLGMSSRMEAILKNQFKQVSLAVSLTLSGVKLSDKTKKKIVSFIIVLNKISCNC